MSWRRLIAPTAFAAVAFAVYPSRTGSMVEVVRIRAHFDSVVAELNARDVGALAPARRIRRAALVARVAAYRKRGEFPHNYDFPGQAVPYFTDRKTGTLSAVAMGTMSTALSTRSIHRQSSIASQREAAARGVVADASLAPTVDARGAPGARVGVSIGF